MKKLLIAILFIVQQTQAIIVNYSQFTGINGKKIHLFADLHIPNKEIAEQQAKALEAFLLKNRDATLYVDGYCSLVQLKPSEVAVLFKDKIIKDKSIDLFNVAVTQGLMEQTTANIQEFALINGIKIQDDPRVVQQYRGSISQYQESILKDINQLSSFDLAMIADCSADNNQDVIIVAGIRHVQTVEQRLKEAGFLSVGIKDTKKLLDIYLTENFQTTIMQSINGLIEGGSKVINSMESLENLETFCGVAHNLLWSNFVQLMDALTVDELSAIE